MSLAMFMNKIQKSGKQNCCAVYTVFVYHWAYVWICDATLYSKFYVFYDRALMLHYGGKNQQLNKKIC